MHRAAAGAAAFGERDLRGERAALGGVAVRERDPDLSVCGARSLVAVGARSRRRFVDGRRFEEIAKLELVHRVCLISKRRTRRSRRSLP